ncbi:SprT family zinc-dependent metalloprotease [Actinoplanes sp. RD1]|uniref:SprT family zinc-dependent metalloprotease n=1 Tax=Actinoplanes sp. RD1 TaxID=3064538 RepID=UPI0027421575|nr:SprT family zinc-dependent metalloprotease [Actinoplanes sp. RD1]
MDLTSARELAYGLMARHRLTGWRLVFDNARTRAGVCRSDRKEIGLSRVLTELYPEEQVRDTVLHEIAHALAGPKHGHDRVWRATAQRIGCSGTRCVPEDAPRAEGGFVGTCAAGHRTTAHRRPVRVRSCPKCSPTFDPAAIYTWTRDGEPAPMHPRYEAELARLRAPGAAVAARTAPLRVGDQVRLTVAGKYAGLPGTIVKRGRTRYHVQTRAGLLTVSFGGVRPGYDAVSRREEAGPA